MERVTYKVSLDVKKNSHNRVMLGAIKGENRSRRIEVTLTEGGKPFLCEDTVSATIYVLKPNQTVPSVNGATIEKNVVIYDLLGSDLDTVGVVTFQLKLTQTIDSNVVTLISTTFEAEVDASIVNDSGTPSQPTYTALELALAQVSTVRANYETDKEALDEALEDTEDAIATVTELVAKETTTLTTAEGYMNSAKTYSESAEASKTLAETSVTNAKAYEELAKQYRDEAQAIANIGTATTTKIGLVKVDGTTITVDSDGKISSKTDWADIDNKPTDFTPSAHNHNDLYYGKSDVYQKTDVYTKTEIDGMKASATEVGFVKPDGTTTTVDADGTIHAVGGGSVSASWGSITGTLSNQTDLNTALSGKVNTGDVYTKSEVDGKIPTSMDWANIDNKPTEFKPESHTHTKSEITDFSHTHDDLYYGKSDVYTKTEVDGKIPTPYSLPVATTTDLGGVKADGTTVTVDADGTIHSTGGSTYTLPTASTSTLGGVKVDGTSITIDSNGVISSSASGDVTSQELTDLKVLGWTVPRELNVRNSLNGSQFTKRIERINLGDLTWGYYSGVFWSTSTPQLSNMKVEGAVYCSKYSTTTERYDSMADKTISSNYHQILSAIPAIIIKDSAYTDKDVFKSAMNGVYLYYELATPITLPIDGNEASYKADKSTITNLLKPTLASQTVNGVTITNNGDGTHTVNGTASATTIFQLVAAGSITVEQGTYKLVGCPNGGSDSKYKLDIVLTVTDYGSGNVFSVSARTTINYATRIVIYANTVCNNLVFKPMLTTDLSATYDDFVPYTGSTGKLNSDVAEINKLVQSQITPIGIYCYQNVIKKRNGIVQLSINAVVSGSDITQSTQIGTIPEGYRPLETENIAIYDNTSKTTNRLIIGTDGKITVQPNTTLTSAASNIQFNTTWII